MRTVSCLAAVALLTVGVAIADYNQDNYDGNYDGLDLGKYYDDGQGYDDMYSYDEFGYGADRGDPEYGGYGEDNLHYYGDEYDEYYEQYGTYGDQYGDDYFFDYEERVTTDCTEDESGQANVTGAICDIKISGVDKVADKLSGGIDGTYKVKGCWNGRPKYKRQNSPKDQDRMLWFSKMFSDWDISSGSEVDEVAIIMYGGDGMEEARPNFVDAGKWHLTSKYSSQNKSEEYGYLKLNLTMKCTDGKALTSVDTTVYQPLITASEVEYKYRAIYTRYGPKHDPDPTVDFTMVVFMVMIGISVVLGIPYMMFRKEGGKGSPDEANDDRFAAVAYLKVLIETGQSPPATPASSSSVPGLILASRSIDDALDGADTHLLCTPGVCIDTVALPPSSAV